MSTATDRQIEDAKLHATAWEAAWNSFRVLADRDEIRGETNSVMSQFATFAMIVSGAYRRTANRGEIED